MAFDWNNFLVLAEELGARADDASRRTAISRAYYFAFNLAFARAESTAGARPVGEASHYWCWNKYAATPDWDCKRLANLGRRMKYWRVRADYKSGEIPRLADEVQRILVEARQFPADLAALNPRFPLP